MLFAGLDMYKKRFDRRYRYKKEEIFLPEDFPDLQANGCTFLSDRGQKLAGCWYSCAGQAIRGVFVLAHGLCGGHLNYLDICHYFAVHGFLVFAYDATGTGESEGSAVGGFPQGVADLDHALRYVKAQERCRDLPIVLFGHSWGAYSACSVLAFNRDVCAAVGVSGFDSSPVMLTQAARPKLGPATGLLMPLFTLMEYKKWGRYASAAAHKGFRSSCAQIMIIHSADDETVHMQSGYDRYHKAYADDARFTFVRLEGRGHAHPLHIGGVRGKLDEALMNRIFCFYLKAIGQEN